MLFFPAVYSHSIIVWLAFAFFNSIIYCRRRRLFWSSPRCSLGRKSTGNCIVFHCQTCLTFYLICQRLFYFRCLIYYYIYIESLFPARRNRAKERGQEKEVIVSGRALVWASRLPEMQLKVIFSSLSDPCFIFTYSGVCSSIETSMLKYFCNLSCLSMNFPSYL